MTKTRDNGFKWPLVAVLLCHILHAAAEDKRHCVNGLLLPDGTCDCYSCWTGDSCAMYASNPPKFLNSFETATLSGDIHDGDVVYRAVAYDPDEDFCKDLDGCACSKVTYFIASQDDTSSFQINKNTGDIRVTGNSFSLYPNYELTIGASDDGVNYDTMTLELLTGSKGQWGGASSDKYLMGLAESSGDSENVLGYTGRDSSEVLSRHKRATVNLPANVTFTLSKYGLNENQTDIKVGLRIQFRLDIVFPSGTTDIQVELFAPDSVNIIMMLCNVQVTVGSNLAVSGKTSADMESLNNSTYNDRAIIRLGTVTNSFSDQNSMTPSTLTVMYEAVMIENINTTDSEEYWVSAGAEYNNENDVWVGQASFTAKTADDSARFTEAPTAAFNGPSSLAIGSCAKYTIDLTLNRPVGGLKVDMVAPVNKSDVMSICAAKVLSVNDAYSCGFDDLWNYVPSYLEDGNSVGYRRVHIDLGRPINKLAYEYNASPDVKYKGVITFGAQVCMNDDPSLVRQVYSLGTWVQIGVSMILAGLFPVTVDPKVTSQNVTPTFNMSFPFSDDISTSNPVIIELDMAVTVNSRADYLLEVMAPFQNNEAIFQVCTVRVVFAGENIACLKQRQFKVDYTISSNTSSSIYPDVAMVSLGSINNLGDLGWVHSNFSERRNIVTFQIIFRATEHPAASPGSSHDIYFGMFVGTEKLTIGKIAVPVVADTPPDNMTALNTPRFNMSFGGDGVSLVPFGKTAKVLMDIVTARDTIYSPFNIEFIMPNNTNQAMIKICKVDVERIGANTPCLVEVSVERAVQMVSSFGENVTDRAVVSLGSLCNMALVDDELEDHVILSASVVLLNHPKFKVDPQTMISAGVMYSSTNLWVGQLSIKADTNPANASLKQPPYLAIVPNNGKLTSIPWGYPARYLVRIKISPNDSTPLSLNVTTTDSALSLCGVLFVRAGQGYPCLEPPLGMLFNEDQVLGVNSGGYIDLQFTSNVAYEAMTLDDSFDSSTIELEIVVMLTSDSTLAPDGSTHMLQLVLNYEQGYSTHTTATVTVTATSDTSVVQTSSVISTSISGAMYAVSITGQDTASLGEDLGTIVKSESKRIVVNVDTLFNSTSQLSVTVTTPTNLTNVMEVLYIGLLDAGDNLPCVKARQTKSSYQPRVAGGAYNDFGTLDLGYVCNIGTTRNDTFGDPDRLRVESVVRLLNSTQVTPGTMLQVHAAIISNNTEMFVYSISFTVGDVKSFTSVSRDNAESPEVAFNSTVDPVIVGISEKKVFSLVCKIPPYTSSTVTLDANTPVGTSAIMTLIDVKVGRSGKNLPDLQKNQNDLAVTRSSTYNTSQVTLLQVDFGVVSNPGVTYTSQQNTSDDNTFSIDFTLQMADNAAAVDGSKHNVSFGMHVSKFVYLLDVTVQVKRTGNEALVFNVSSVVDSINSTADRVEIDTILSLSNSSSAEGQESILNLFLPTYVSFVRAVVTSPLKEILSVYNVDNSVTLYFGPLFFTDVVHLTSVITTNTSYGVPSGITGQNSVCKFQPIANTNTVNDTAGDMNYVNFTIKTTPKGNAGCVFDVMGMESGAIKDCQISSSTDSIVGFEAVEGRYNTGSGWSPFVHLGKVKEERFFQVYFGYQVLVIKIKLQQGGQTYAEKLGVSYSNDGMSWVDSPYQLFPVPGANDQEIDVPSPQSSSYIRIKILDLLDETLKVVFRFEFIGCKTSGSSLTDPCSTVYVAAPSTPDFARRTFIKAGSTLFVCDGVKGPKGIQQKCLSTEDGSTWQVLDRRLGCILGFDSLEPLIYGVAAKGNNYMVSKYGVEWHSAVSADVEKAKLLPTFKPATKVPVDGDIKLNSVTPDPAFIDSGYGATNDGLKVNQGGWKTIFKWSLCC